MLLPTLCGEFEGFLQRNHKRVTSSHCAKDTSQNKQDRQFTHNVIIRRVRIVIFAVERQ